MTLVPPTGYQPTGTPVLHVVVHDVPRPQGSKRHVGRGILVESSDVKTWREAVKQATQDAMDRAQWQTLTAPCEVDLAFRFRRPDGHWRTGRNAHLLRDTAPRHPGTRSQGDIDKLARGVLDAITAAGAIADDSLVAVLNAAKCWSIEGPPGATIMLRPL